LPLIPTALLASPIAPTAKVAPSLDRLTERPKLSFAPVLDALTYVQVEVLLNVNKEGA